MAPSPASFHHLCCLLDQLLHAVEAVVLVQILFLGPLVCHRRGPAKAANLFHSRRVQVRSFKDLNAARQSYITLVEFQRFLQLQVTHKLFPGRGRNFGHELDDYTNSRQASAPEHVHKNSIVSTGQLRHKQIHQEDNHTYHEHTENNEHQRPRLQSLVFFGCVHTQGDFHEGHHAVRDVGKTVEVEFVSQDAHATGKSKNGHEERTQKEAEL
mmetsp:Transcript_32666/g.87699  ORF Transcript_32666/g.87699 Transcript_32666/m.87699 type:complete len:212 (+) Transcript_32666:416-1051(+)